MNMRALLVFFGALSWVVCLLNLPQASATTYSQPLAGRGKAYKNDWTADGSNFVRQGPSPTPTYNPLTGNNQSPGEVFNLFSGKPVVGGRPAYNPYTRTWAPQLDRERDYNPPAGTYNPYAGTWGYQPGNGWTWRHPHHYWYYR
jgi:hypothetical protein